MPTSFEKACTENIVGEVHTMLTQNRPVPVEIRNKQSGSALMLACAIGAEEICRVLIDNNCDFEARDLHEKTAIFFLNVVKLLIENNADVNKRDEKINTALHLATESNNIEIVKFLAELNIDINPRGNIR